MARAEAVRLEAERNAEAARNAEVARAAEANRQTVTNANTFSVADEISKLNSLKIARAHHRRGVSTAEATIDAERLNFFFPLSYIDRINTLMKNTSFIFCCRMGSAGFVHYFVREVCR